MGIIKNIVGNFFQSSTNNDFNVEKKSTVKDLRLAECPSCKEKLQKIPGRKTKCPNCKKFMFVRTRPKDNARIVVTKEQADIIDEEWAIVSGAHDDFISDKEEFEQEREILRKRFGREPPINDIKWGILNKNLLKFSQNMDWGLYRNTRFNMGEILRKELKLQDALITYLEVCYLDLNGPNNNGCLDDPELLEEFPPFDPNNSAFLAPGVIDRIKRIIKKLNLSNGELKEFFVKHSNRIYDALKLPLSPEECWEKINKSLKEDKK